MHDNPLLTLLSPLATAWRVNKVLIQSKLSSYVVNEMTFYRSIVSRLAAVDFARLSRVRTYFVEVFQEVNATGRCFMLMKRLSLRNYLICKSVFAAIYLSQH